MNPTLFVAGLLALAVATTPVSAQGSGSSGSGSSAGSSASSASGSSASGCSASTNSGSSNSTNSGSSNSTNSGSSNSTNSGSSNAGSSGSGSGSNSGGSGSNSGSSGSGSGSNSGSSSQGGGCLCVGPAMVSTTGAGCAPSTGMIPYLNETNLPVPGHPLGVDVHSPSTPHSVGLLVFGFSTTWDPVLNLALPRSLSQLGYPSCSQLTSYEFPIGVLTDGSGDATYSTQIPALAKWCDRVVTFQVFFLDATGDLYASAGLSQQFGY